MKAPSFGIHLLLLMKPWDASRRLSSPPLKRKRTGALSCVRWSDSSVRATSSMTPTQDAQSLAPVTATTCVSLLCSVQLLHGIGVEREMNNMPHECVLKA